MANTLTRHLMSRSFLTIFFLVASVSLRGQQAPAPQPAVAQTDDKTTLSVKVNVVTALATVRDKHGHFVGNLTKDDFVLNEDGRPQDIRYFSQDTDLPLTLGLLVDTSGSQIRLLGQERAASRVFLDQVLRENKDKAFIVHFDHEVELLQDLTSSREKLASAVDQIQPTDRPNTSGGNSPDPGGHGRHGGGFGGGGGTQLYDAIFLAGDEDELMKKQTGRKAVIILSDGVDRGSKVGIESAIAAAQRSDTVVYSILFRDEEHHEFHGFDHGGLGRHGGGHRREPEEDRPDGKKILERISKETGGRLFEVSKKEPLEQIYKDIQEELRNQYSLGYTPDKNSGLGYHKISLTAKEKELKVQTRDGYYTNR
jgi:VWFA-related protein